MKKALIFFLAFLFSLVSFGQILRMNAWYMPDKTTNFPQDMPIYSLIFVGSIDSLYSVTSSYTTSDDMNQVITDGNYIAYPAGAGSGYWAIDGDSLKNTSTGSYDMIYFASPLFTDFTRKSVTNTTVGIQAGDAYTTATNNLALGYVALTNATTGDQNVALGASAMQSITTGRRNVAIGYQALQDCQTNNNNMALGYQAMSNNLGTANVGIGFNALENLAGTASNFNVAIGYNAMPLLPDAAAYNVGVGANVGQNSVGSYNIFLGYAAGQNEAGDYKLYIEPSNSSSPLIWGDFNADSLRFHGSVYGTTNIIAGNNVEAQGSIVAEDDLEVEDNVWIGWANAPQATDIILENLPNTPSYDSVLVMYGDTVFKADKDDFGGVTINDNTNNYILTASGSANTINGESEFTFNGGVASIQSSTTARLFMGSYTNTNGSAPLIQMERSRGSIGSKSAITLGSTLGYIQFDAHYDASSTYSGAEVSVVATENWSSGNGGTRMDFSVTSQGGTTPTDIMHLYEGKVGILTSVPDSALDVAGGATFDEDIVIKGGWRTWTPTISWTSGTPSAPTIVARYMVVNNTVHFGITINGNNDSGGGTGIANITLPITPADVNNIWTVYCLYDANYSGSGFFYGQLGAAVDGNDNTASNRKLYQATATITNGNDYIFSYTGFYEY